MLTRFEYMKGVVKPVAKLDTLLEKHGGYVPYWTLHGKSSAGRVDTVPTRGLWAMPQFDETRGGDDEPDDPVGDRLEEEAEAQEEEGPDPTVGRRHSPSGFDGVTGAGVEDIMTGDPHSHRQTMQLLRQKFDAQFARNYVPVISDCGIFDDTVIWGLEDAETMVPVTGQFHFGLAGYSILWV
jgi:hypothetical protein